MRPIVKFFITNVVSKGARSLVIKIEFTTDNNIPVTLCKVRYQASHRYLLENPFSTNRRTPLNRGICGQVYLNKRKHYMTKAVATLLYGTNYLPGVLVLGVAMRHLIDNVGKKGRDIELVVLIEEYYLSKDQIQLLESIYDKVIGITALSSSHKEKLSETLKRPELGKTFSKIHLWSLQQYSQILYLDADTLPNINSGQLQGSVLDLLQLEFATNRILASPDSGFSDVFNSGVFVIKPNDADYQNLVRLATDVKPKKSTTFDGADQGLLNQYFNSQPDWVQDLLGSKELDVLKADNTRSSNWIKLPFLYNVTPTVHYEYLPACNYFASSLPDASQEAAKTTSRDQDTSKYLSSYFEGAFNYFHSNDSRIKLIHFIGPHKPWKSTKADGTFKPWWDVWKLHFGDLSISDVVHKPIEALGRLNVGVLHPGTLERKSPAPAQEAADPKKVPLGNSNTLDSEELTDRLKSLEASDQTGFSGLPKEDTEVQLKVFPWEFDENRPRPERSFDF